MLVQIDFFGLPTYGDEQEYQEAVKLAAPWIYMRVEHLATPA
jgi:hypothetical protein